MAQLTLNLGDDFPAALKAAGFTGAPRPAGIKITPRRLRLEAPDGTAPGIGNCGIVALAFATGQSVAQTWREVLAGLPARTALDRKILAKVKRGGTYHSQREDYLTRKGVEFEDVCLFQRRVTLQGLMADLDPAAFYMVTITRHVVTVHNGKIMDQRGVTPIAEFWARRKFVRAVTLITPQ